MTTIMSSCRWRRRLVPLAGTLLGLVQAACSGSLVFEDRERAATDAGGKGDDPNGGDGDQATEFTLDVEASRTWSDTGIDLEGGEMFSLLASGTIEFGPGPTGPEGHAGDEHDQYNVVPCESHAGLIGRVGSDGEPFFVGAQAVSVATEGGRLYLGVNDTDVGNNSGSFAVRLTTGIDHVATEPRGVTIPATVAWTDSEIDLEGGDVLVITASGSIDDNVASPETTYGPGGRPDSTGSVHSILGCALHASLLAKVGDNGAPFVVGETYAAPAPLAGRLYLGLNDMLLSDEGGKLAATVTLIER